MVKSSLFTDIQDLMGMKTMLKQYIMPQLMPDLMALVVLKKM